MTQTSRQNAKNNIEKDFFKLMNNANFGFDCRNNASNTKFEPVFNEMEEISYIKRYYNFSNKPVDKFVKSEILERQIQTEYEQAIAEVREDNPFKIVHIREIENAKKTNLDGLKCLVDKEKKGNKRKMKKTETQVQDALKNKKIKTMIDFDKTKCNSIKSILIQSSDTVNVSLRFFKGKMLMFPKLSLKSFVYDMIDISCFPDEEIRQIYDFFQTEKCFLYQNLTNTDSTSLLFNFICKLDSSIPESEARKIIFQCMKKSKIAERLDVSDQLWKDFEMHNPKTKKQMGLYEVESVDNPNICTIAINPKEYFEKFKDRNINKKHKGVRRNALGMNFESYAGWIAPLRLIDS